MLIGVPLSILYVLMDGTGAPVVKKETAGRAGKKDGEPARTREVKLGCVFTQTTWDAKSYPIRDPDSTTYVAAIEPSEQFGKRLYLEAWKRAGVDTTRLLRSGLHETSMRLTILAGDTGR
jgi:hypothetical protein